MKKHHPFITRPHIETLKYLNANKFANSGQAHINESTKANTGNHSTINKDSTHLKGIVTNINSMISTDWATLQAYHESIQSDLNSQFANILAETDTQYEKLVKEVKDQMQSKINENESTLKQYQSQIELNELNYSKVLVELKNGHELELNKFKSEYDKKINKFQNEIMQFENKIQGYNFEFMNLEKSSANEFINSLVVQMISNSIINSNQNSISKLNKCIESSKRDFQQKQNDLKSKFERKLNKLQFTYMHEKKKTVIVSKPPSNFFVNSGQQLLLNKIDNSNKSIQHATPDSKNLSKTNISNLLPSPNPSTKNLKYSICESHSNSTSINHVDIFNKRIFETPGEFEIDSLLVNNHQRLKEKLEGIVKQIEQYKAKKMAIANEIKHWTKEFQDRHHREPSKEDKQEIKSTQADYQKCNKIYEKLKETHTKTMQDIQDLEDEINQIRVKKSQSVSQIDSNIDTSADATPQSIKQKQMYPNSENMITLSDQIQRNNFNQDNLMEALKNGNNKDSLSSAEREIFNLFDNMKNQLKTNIKGQYETKFSEFNKKYNNLKDNYKKTYTDLKTVSGKYTELNQKLDKQDLVEKSKLKKLEEFEKLGDEQKLIETRNLSLKKNYDELLDNQSVLTTQQSNEVKARKEQLNKLQDIEGHIRVFCRLRPILPIDNESDQIVSVQDEYSVNFSQEYNSKNFNFDGCYNEHIGQETIFKSCTHLLRAALDGYNVCIFAQGQTGSGKTQTMHGSESEKIELQSLAEGHANTQEVMSKLASLDQVLDSDGIVPRCIQFLFDSLVSMEFKFTMSIAEIYKDSFHDILQTLQQHCCNPHNLEVYQDKFTKTNQLKHACTKQFDSAADALQCQRLALALRRSAPHNLNSNSSRSHLIMSIQLEVTSQQKDKVVSRLSLVDLAGSERVKMTGAQLDMIKEAAAINQSLSALQDVMKKLALQDSSSAQPNSGNVSNIPQRSNKLTHYMSDSLGGNSRSLMIVNINPFSAGSFETQSSLVYASRVRGVKNNVFKLQDNKQLRILKSTIEDLEDQLDKCKHTDQSHVHNQDRDQSAQINVSNCRDTQNASTASRAQSMDKDKDYLKQAEGKKLNKNKSFVMDGKREYKMLSEKSKKENKSFSNLNNHQVPKK